MEPIFTMQQAQGKTILSCHESTLYAENVIITFDDNTYLFLRADNGSFYDDTVRVKVDDNELEDEDLLTIGAITQFQYDQARKYIEKKHLVAAEQSERDEYERLKLKFEGGQ